jgi:anti-sigma regulatory factor (Ser/Thr protein kinase)
LTRTPTEEEIEEMCLAAQEAARNHVVSKVSLKRISDIDVTVEAIGDKPLTLLVDVGIELESGNEDLGPLVDEATDIAFLAAEKKARELNLCRDTPA